ncbi:MAG: CRISPR-associated endonuclease Cas2 [Candidatus Aenigmatarchaeota archaeon]
MFVILSYDVNEKRVLKANSVCSKYLFWILNSVFYGKISKSNFNLLISELKEVLNPVEDRVISFCFPTNVKYKIIGFEEIRDEPNILW